MIALKNVQRLKKYLGNQLARNKDDEWTLAELAHCFI